MNVSNFQSQDILLMSQDTIPDIWTGGSDTITIDDLLAEQRLDMHGDAVALPPGLPLSREPSLPVHDPLDQLLAIDERINGSVNEGLDNFQCVQHAGETMCQGTCVADTSQRLDFLSQQINILAATVTKLSGELGDLLEMERQTRERMKNAINQLGHSIHGSFSGDGRL